MALAQVGAHDPWQSVVSACSCRTTSLATPFGRIVILWITGEVDTGTLTVLQTAMAAALESRPSDLVVDLAGMTFCHADGHAAIIAAATSAATCRSGYSVSAASAHVDRVWAVLWPVADRPTRHPTAAAGVIAAMARQAARRDHARRPPMPLGDPEPRGGPDRSTTSS